jgi:hypothetical protein
MKLSIPPPLAVLMLLASTNLATDRRDYSGSYTLAGAKGSFKLEKGSVCTIKVLQPATVIEVTRVMDGKLNSAKLPLDGSGGAYTSSGGIKGKCKGQFKGEFIFLEAFVNTHSEPQRPTVPLRRRERAELTADSKTLTVRSEVDFPGMAVNLVDPWSDIYRRI